MNHRDRQYMENAWPSQEFSEAYEQIRGDFGAAKNNRFKRRLTGYSSQGSGADYHYRNESDFLRIMERARDIDRNDPVVPQGISRLIANVFQDGFKLDPKTGDDKLDSDLAARWESWSTDPLQCHSGGTLDFHEMAALNVRHMIVDGDIFAVPHDDGAIEAVEAHRCRTPRNTTRNVVHGVLMNEFRRPLEYWFTREDIDPNRQLVKVSEIKSFNALDSDGNPAVLHIKNPKRFTQTRGISAMAPIMDTAGQFDDLFFAKLVQAQVASCIAIFRERSSDFASKIAGTAYGATSQQTQSDGSSQTVTELKPGLEIAGAPGEKLQGFSPSVPNPEFFTHATLILTFIAINFDLPVAVLLLDPSQTNFSGWRGAMDQARFGFSRIQRQARNKYHIPVYRWKVRQWAAEDPSIARRLDMALKHRWILPSWAYIEPEKDAKADSLMIRERLASRRYVIGRRGMDAEDTDKEIIEDNERFIVRAIEAANRITDAHPDADVTWRDVAFLAPDLKTKDAPGPVDDEPQDKPATRQTASANGKHN
ncbi:MAG: hypothetical protein AMXMBFR84_37780 [Candidatus Hydrogenedentota bacterium]